MHFISKPRRDDAMIASLEETTHKKTLTLTAKALKKKLSLNLRSLDVSYNLVWLQKKNGYAYKNGFIHQEATRYNL